MGSIRSELLDPKGKTKERCNVSSSEVKAIHDLIKLQKEREIIIKPCDKGGGIILLDFDDYLKKCEEHLQSVLKNDEEPHT